MKGIPLYGRYTSDDPATLAAAVARNHQDFRRRQEMPRDEYPILPWTMDQLPGTAWRNLYTFGLETIHEIRENRDGKLGPDPDIYINSMFSIGLWANARFVIGHYVRVDHLPPTIQMQWHMSRLSYQARQATKARDTLQKQKSAYTKRDLQYRLDQLTQASQHARAFATLHRLPTSSTWNLAHLPMFSPIGAKQCQEATQSRPTSDSKS